MRISDWSSDVCSSDLGTALVTAIGRGAVQAVDFQNAAARHAFDFSAELDKGIADIRSQQAAQRRLAGTAQADQGNLAHTVSSPRQDGVVEQVDQRDRKSTRLNSSH